MIRKLVIVAFIGVFLCEFNYVNAMPPPCEPGDVLCEDMDDTGDDTIGDDDDDDDDIPDPTITPVPDPTVAPDEDLDGDGIADEHDNCPKVANTDQRDGDSDGIGDLCQNDMDADTILDDVDNCMEAANTDQLDKDKDGIGDVCDTFFNVEHSSSAEVASDDATDSDNSEASSGCGYIHTNNLDISWMLTLLVTLGIVILFRRLHSFQNRNL